MTHIYTHDDKTHKVRVTQVHRTIGPYIHICTICTVKMRHPESKYLD